MYIEGFLAAVPKENKQKYLEQAKQGAALFKKLGANRVVECWQIDVPHGKTTDFYGAVKAKDDEEVISSWIEYPNKEIRDNAYKAMMEDSEMKELGKSMPFDGSRMIFGGFESILDLH